MKPIFLLAIGSIFSICSCSSDSAKGKGERTDQPASKTTSTQIESKTDNGPTTSGDGVQGDWKLALETYDENNNKLLDDAERQKAFSNHYFYRFSPGGSALINFTGNEKGAFKGHYELNKKKGLDHISVYLDEGEEKGPEGDYYIISVNRQEMVLLETLGENTFWIFRRV